jgi:RNA polymerase sigma-70 factor (ECF subfamily)
LRKNKKYKFVDIFDMQNKEVETAVDAKIPSNLGPAIEAAIASLPDKYKTAFILRDIDEMPYEEVARVLSVPLGTVKSRVNRARSILREKLKPRMEERNALSKGALLPVSLL